MSFGPLRWLAAGLAAFVVTMVVRASMPAAPSTGPLWLVVYAPLVTLLCAIMVLRAVWPGERAKCMHHDPATSQSWVRGQLINAGAGKMFRCRRCGAAWFA